MSEYVPEPSGGAWQGWAQRLNRYLARTRSILRYKVSGESASEDGVLLWDPQNKYPVVSKDGEFTQIVLEDGHANLSIGSDQTAAAANTAYALTFDTPSGNVGISLGTPSSRIVFEKSGEYLLAFTAQITSTSASTVNFWFWPRLNGTDVSGSTIKAALHQNTATTVVSRSAIFNISADDYLEVMWAVDSTNGFLDNHAATSFAPSTPSATLAITRIHG